MTLNKALRILIFTAIVLIFLTWYTHKGPTMSSRQHDPRSKRSTTAVRGGRPTIIPQYEIVPSKDVSYINAVRKSYRVRVPREMTRNELAVIAQRIVDDVLSHQRIDAMAIFFFLPDSDMEGIFTAGKATWAPDGDWAKAWANLPPRLVVEVGGALGDLPKDAVIVDLPVATKKAIFFQIVAYEDTGMKADESHAALATRFGITVEQASNIGHEGIYKGWPMPRVEKP